jgi:hypothetical protein
MQPVFTRLANLLQKKTYASGQDHAIVARTASISRAGGKTVYGRRSVLPTRVPSNSDHRAASQALDRIHCDFAGCLVQRISKRIVTKFFPYFLCFTSARMRNIATLHYKV